MAQVKKVTNHDDNRAFQLFQVCMNGNFETVTIFLKRGYAECIDTPGDENGNTCLIAASTNGHTAVVNLLLDKGAKIELQNNDGFSALMAASRNGHTDTVKLLLDRGAQVNIQNNRGESSLMLASDNGHTDTVKLLIEKGAQVNIQDNNGASPLIFASHNGHINTVQQLIEKGARIDMQTQNGQFALMVASLNGHSNIVKLLIEKGARVNMQDNCGRSALHGACFYGSKRVAQILIDHHCNVALKDSDGETALDIACDQPGFADIVELLLSSKDQNASQSSGAQSSTLPEESLATAESQARQRDISPAATMDSPRENAQSPAQITPHSHNETSTNNPVGIGSSNTADSRVLTIDDLKRKTGITDAQLDTEIIEHDLYELAGLFDEVDSFFHKLGLTESQKTDIKDLAHRNGTQIAMTKALKLWCQPNPLAATFRALLKVLLNMRRGDVAFNVCKYIARNVHSPK